MMLHEKFGNDDVFRVKLRMLRVIDGARAAAVNRLREFVRNREAIARTIARRPGVDDGLGKLGMPYSSDLFRTPSEEELQHLHEIIEEEGVHIVSFK